MYAIRSYYDLFDVKFPKAPRQREGVIDKFGQLLMRGNLNDQSFREYLSETFGLTPDLTAEQAENIKDLSYNFV